MSHPSNDRSGDGLGQPASRWYRIIPSDVAELNPIPRALYVDVTGTLSVVDADGSIMNITAAAVGYHPLRPRLVRSTGTTAVVYGLY